MRSAPSTPSSSLNNAKVKLNANGSYTVDASAADALGAGESVSHTFTYNVLQTNVDGTSTHTVSFKVTITGTNDGPVIAGEVFTGAVTEAGSNADTGTLSTSSSFTFDDRGPERHAHGGVHAGRGRRSARSAP